MNQVERQALGRQALIELARRAKIKQYQRDPALWLTERFGEAYTTLKWSDHPGYEEHNWDGTMDPFLKAMTSLAARKWVGIESATSTGKTYLLPRIIYWFLDVFPNSLVVTTAPKQQQLKAVLWSEMSKCFHKFKKIRPKAEMFSLRVLPDGTSSINKAADGEELTDAHMAIGVVSGVRANEESATKMQGYHRENMLFVIEECAGVPAPVMTAIKNTCTGDNNVVIAVGNPDAMTDALHQFCILPHVEHIIISALDHPNVVTGKAIIPGAVTIKSIDQRREEYGEGSNFFKSRCRGIAPKQASDALIHYDWVAQCCPLLNDKLDIEEDLYSFNALGIDVANSEAGDMAAMAFGKLNSLDLLMEFPCPNANHLAHNVIFDDHELREMGIEPYGTPKLHDWQIEPAHVGVDGVGVGVGTVNAFADYNYTVKALQGGAVVEAIPHDAEEKPLYKFSNLRTQMYFQLRLDLQAAAIILNIRDRKLLNNLIRELTIISYSTSTGIIRVEKKDEIKKKLGKSPNLADVVAYWNWVRRNRKPVPMDTPFI